MSNRRLTYLDFCKFFAMLMVTWGHCAQSISGETFPCFLGGGGKLIAFHMPLFFIVSGYLMNTDKIRNKPFLKFIQEKSQRLIVPAVCWYLILSITSLHMPKLLGTVTFYWYLTALFICNIIIWFAVKCCKHRGAVATIAIAFVLLCPGMDFVNINFMMPFLWFGIWIRYSDVLNKRYSQIFFIASVVIGMALYQIWNENFTVYKAPFIIDAIDTEMCFKYIVRFAIGVSLSFAVMWIGKRFQNNRFISLPAQLGKYTLLAYTFSFVLNNFMSYFLRKAGLNTSEPLILEVTSLLWAITIYFLTVKLYNVLSRYKFTRFLLLGE